MRVVVGNGSGVGKEERKGVGVACVCLCMYAGFGLHTSYTHSHTRPFLPPSLFNQVLAMPLLERFVYTWVALLFCRMKYYFAWKVRPSVHCSFSLGRVG